MCMSEKWETCIRCTLGALGNKAECFLSTGWNLTPTEPLYLLLGGGHVDGVWAGRVQKTSGLTLSSSAPLHEAGGEWRDRWDAKPPPVPKPSYFISSTLRIILFLYCNFPQWVISLLRRGLGKHIHEMPHAADARELCRMCWNTVCCHILSCWDELDLQIWAQQQTQG